MKFTASLATKTKTGVSHRWNETMEADSYHCAREVLRSRHAGDPHFAIIGLVEILDTPFTRAATKARESEKRTEIRQGGVAISPRPLGWRFCVGFAVCGVAAFALIRCQDRRLAESLSRKQQQQRAEYELSEKQRLEQQAVAEAASQAERNRVHEEHRNKEAAKKEAAAIKEARAKADADRYNQTKP